MDGAAMAAPATSAMSPRRTRRSRKRVHFREIPKPAYPVRAIWDAATAEEKERAHRTCTVMLEWWLGKITKAEAGATLELPEVRVWQLSQQALSGMLAGLLRQPRARGKVVLQPTDPSNDPRALRQRIQKLEQELKRSNDVIHVLRMLPSSPRRENGGTAPATKAKAPRPKGKGHGAPSSGAAADRSGAQGGGTAQTA